MRRILPGLDATALEPQTCRYTLTPDAADYLISIGFDDLSGLQAYLDHPAHAELAARFYDSLSSALVFDFEEGGVEGIALEAPHAV